MKYLILVPDGFADEPHPDLDGKTPKQVARTPYMDDLARRGQVGIVDTVPEGMYPGSDIANLAILGYDPAVYYTGRGPIEALALGVPLDERDVAFRCSLVTTDGERLLDYSSGHIPTPDAHTLMGLVGQKLATRRVQFYPGVSYRHVMVWRDGSDELATTPPHEMVDQPLSERLPRGEGEELLRRLVYDSLELLDGHPINRRRRDEGLPPANTIWPWSPGRPPRLPSFFSRFGVTGSMIAEVDVTRGLAIAAGLFAPTVPGTTGWIDTDYRALAAYALDALREKGQDFVYVHIEAPDEAGHKGDLDAKIGAIQDIDALVLGPILDGLKALGDGFRMLILPDHPTPVARRTHTRPPVPFLFFTTERERANTVPFDERALGESVLHVEEGHRLIEMLFKEVR